MGRFEACSYLLLLAVPRWNWLMPNVSEFIGGNGHHDSLNTWAHLITWLYYTSAAK
jgi:hypothetical protein